MRWELRVLLFAVLLAAVWFARSAWLELLSEPAASRDAAAMQLLQAPMSERPGSTSCSITIGTPRLPFDTRLTFPEPPAAAPPAP